MLSTYFKNKCKTEVAAAAVVISDLLLSPVTVPLLATKELVKVLCIVLKNLRLYLRHRGSNKLKFKKEQILKAPNGKTFKITYSLFPGLIPGIFTFMLVNLTIKGRMKGESWKKIMKTIG